MNMNARSKPGKVDNKRPMPRKRTTGSIAISFLLLSLLLIFSAVSFAETEVGKVTNLSGQLFAQKADGTRRVLTTQSVVEQGDTLVTEKMTYARIKFTDNSEVIMRPGTQFKVSQYNFEPDQPAADKAVFDLVKGWMRSITGLIGKRGDRDSYKLMTYTAVVGIRGTTYETKICEGNCGPLPNGVYFFVMEGIINVSNAAGAQDVSAGQHAYVQTMESMPKILPGNPGIDFTLPASIVLGSAAAFGVEPKEPTNNEKAVAVLQGKLDKINNDIKENKRLLDYYRYRTIRAGMVMSGHSAGPGTHLGPNGESVEPLQPSTAFDEFAQNQETAQYYKDSLATLQELAEKTQKDIKAAQTLTAEKKEPRKESGGGGY